ncbi:MAG: family 20 glycosylhydrolase [Cellulophaga sp.]
MKEILKLLILLFLLFLVLLVSCGQKKSKFFVESDIAIIPIPQQLELKQGSFIFNKETVFVVNSDEQKELTGLLTQKFKKVSGWELETVNTKPSRNYVQFITDDELKEEAYKLHIENNAIHIFAKEFSGFHYGLETVRQLLPVTIESEKVVQNVSWEVPNIEINDAPRFKWRGLMLDVSRHFFDKDYVLGTIDQMALLKMNMLHLHLVDDQGWRIEIKKYPRLTEVGGFRVGQGDKHWGARSTPGKGEKAMYGGFYTQEDIREIVSYATTKGITVVPEIEMPAHVMSAIAAYPELSCNEKSIMVPSGGVWPITDIYCAGKESTFEFLENVLTEVMDLFPSKYIHVGGDEATRTNWKTCSHCKNRVAKEGLKNEEELQSYFIKRMERFISSKDRILVGWDEILEGGLAPGATVMSWRGVKGGLEASEQGHDVVMTPGSYCYFDHYQGSQDVEPLAWGGYSPLSKVYEFDPVVDSMTTKQAAHVLGGQANLWSEYVATSAHSEYMIYPRLAALSEAVWSAKENKKWEDFSVRIQTMFGRYEAMGIHYAKSSYQVNADTKMDAATGNLTISLKNEFPNSDIRYVLNEGDLKTDAIKYTRPIQINASTTIKAAMFQNDVIVGAVFEKNINYHKAVGKKVSYKELYHDSYQGAKEIGMVNVLRGSKNFHDGQWQGWLGNDLELTIDLENRTDIGKVVVGSLENQGSGIYFPVAVEVFISSDNEKYNSVGRLKRDYKANNMSELKNFEISFEKQPARYIKVKVKNLGTPVTGGGSWMFIDEIIVE